MEKVVVCPGCGVKINSADNCPDENFNASKACRELMYQISYYTLSLRDNYFLHQLAVDAYAAQHQGNKTKPISTAFGLVGLYLVNEKNYTGREVQLSHIAIANKSKVWPRFLTPEKNWLTVKDVVEGPENDREILIKKWSKSVWDAWKIEHEKVATLAKKYLGI
jgi:hypothetical protein